MTPESASALLDPSTAFGARAVSRLNSEQVVWLTTVAPSGTPQPNPVWFSWRDGEFLIFTQPGTPKLRNISRNPRVALNLNSTATGGEVVIFAAAARVAQVWPGAAEIAAFAAKYADGLAGLGMSPEEFFADYSIAVRIVPDRVRGF